MKRRILAIAYSCEPGRGSEPGAGWTMARMLARIGKVVVLTTPTGRRAIEATLATTPEQAHLSFQYIDIPQFARRWKLESRNPRLHYLFWQVAAWQAAREMKANENFDFAWHITLASIWFGSFVSLLGLPFVYGPVGGGIKTPLRLLPSIGVRGSLYEIGRSLFHLMERLGNPLSRLSLCRAALILVQNRETFGRLPPRYQPKAAVFPNAILEGSIIAPFSLAVEQPTAIFVGELRAFKGASFAIHALVDRPEWRLLICGAGPDEPRLRRIANRLQVNDRVSFLGWIKRSDVLRLLREVAHVLIFPSLHDEAPMAVAEALACGLAVICMDHGGPPLLAGRAARVLPSRASGRRIVETLAAHLSHTTQAERLIAHQCALALSMDVKTVELVNLLSRLVPALPARP